MSTRFFNPIFQALDDAGVARTDGTLTFFSKGTTTKLDTFQDAALTIPNSNPVVTKAGARMPDIWLQDTDYTALFQIGGEEVWTADVSGAVVPVASEASAGLVRLATASEMQSGVATDAVPTVARVTSGIQIDTAQIVSGIFDPSRLPSASETAKGAVELATQAEMDSGTTGLVPDAAKIKTFVDAAVSGALSGSNASPGFITFTNGLIVQWGTESSMAEDESRNVSLPTPFTSTHLVQFATATTLPNQGASFGAGPGSSLSSILLHNGTDLTLSANWLAIGV